MDRSVEMTDEIIHHSYNEICPWSVEDVPAHREGDAHLQFFSGNHLQPPSFCYKPYTHRFKQALGLWQFSPIIETYKTISVYKILYSV